MELDRGELTDLSPSPNLCFRLVVGGYVGCSLHKVMQGFSVEQGKTSDLIFAIHKESDSVLKV